MEVEQYVMSRSDAERLTEKLQKAWVEYGEALVAQSELKRKYSTEFGLDADRKTERRVYFIQAGEDGPIKVGSAAKPHSRLKELQTSSPYKLRLLGSVPGGYVEERRLHRLFGYFRLHGEWFEPIQEIKDYIEMRMI